MENRRVVRALSSGGFKAENMMLGSSQYEMGLKRKG